MNKVLAKSQFKASQETSMAKNNTELVFLCCSDNLKFGVQFSRKFVDAPERSKTWENKNVRNLMNLHNNEAGRQVKKLQIEKYHFYVLFNPLSMCIEIVL